ncbi:hypothetical protein E9549_00930 [Blastococcus sp. MG754426]|uniref:hypothetical protein n=1 Tax=unclassified Blastococcus TaxID=2619396 RepID=UPI001EF07503|nr:MULTISPECIES: hypothetical protein [unclassified Blastococcus]MCF6505980.1 hypothetical protein [Blastococcus sp. MG754426]MCF6510634.1 hypothetical protein [Blastococcus sp. MG754427]
MSAPLWRQAFDAAERAVAPRAESLVRTEHFALGTALVRRAQTLASRSAQQLSARAWHLLNLPAGSDISRLRAQVGSLDREVRRLTIQLEQERRRSAAARPRAQRPTTSPTTEDSDADGAQPADGARPRPPRRRAQHPPRP